MRIIAGCFSEVGNRESNQDSVYYSVKDGTGIFVVADGMGGHDGGEIASTMIIEEIERWTMGKVSHEAVQSGNTLRLKGNSQKGIDELSAECRKLLIDINEDIYGRFKKEGMIGGSTVALLILKDDRCCIYTVGDSRVYRLRDDNIKQLSVDDVWENLPEIKDSMTESEKKADSRYGKLTQAVGSDNMVEIRHYEDNVQKNDVFMLCSDGVYKVCTESELESILKKKAFFGGIEKALRNLKITVLKKGSRDNFSAVMCKVI